MVLRPKIEESVRSYWDETAYVHTPNDVHYGANLGLYLPIYEFLEGVIYMNLMVWNWCMA